MTPEEQSELVNNLNSFIITPQVEVREESEEVISFEVFHVLIYVTLRCGSYCVFYVNFLEANAP